MTARLALLAFVVFVGAALADDKAEPSFRGKTLTQWRTDLKGRDAEVRRAAALALAQMGKAAAPAVPDLTAALQDEQPAVRLASATALWRLGTVARAAAPELIKVYKDSRQGNEVRLMAAYALGKIGASCKEVVPTFRETLRDGEPREKRVAALVLGQIGPDARDAVPDLIRAFEDSMDPITAKKAGDALKKIDPDAAAKAGVK